MSKKIKVIFEGQPFPTVTALARYLGELSNAEALSTRLKRRNAPLDALTREHVCPQINPELHNPAARPIEFEGQFFKAKRALCKAYNVKHSTFNTRIKLDWTMRQALGVDEPPPHDRNRWKSTELIDGECLPKTVVGHYKLYQITNEVNGKFYIGITILPLEQRRVQHCNAAKLSNKKSPLSCAIRKYGSSAFTIRLLQNDATNYRELQEQEISEIRLRNACKLGYNVSLGGSMGTPKAICVEGKIFPSYGAAAEAFGILPSTFNLRLQQGWSPEQAVNLEKREGHHYAKDNEFALEGVVYLNFAQAARAYDLNKKTIKMRLKKGLTLREAFGIDPMPKQYRHSGPVILEGVKYSTLKDALNANGLSYDTYRKHTKKV